MSRQRDASHEWRHLGVIFTLLYFCKPSAAQCDALSVPVDTTKWLGYDGSWSPITLNLGSPVQAIDFFPSTAGQETIVIGLDGCDGTVECQSERGGVFAANESTTFQPGSGYNLGLDHNLGMNGAGYYGLETIQVNTAVTLKDQVLAIVNTTEYWTGFLGLGPSNTTYGSTEAQSFLESLTTGDEPQIPSLSYGYTAGASYRLKQVPASLTLGGYDANRFEANDASFSLNSNQQPSLSINSIIMSGMQGGNSTMLSESEQDLFVIDSTTPFLWLPESVADAIGNALGLVYNDTLEVFLYPNTSVYEDLFRSELSFTFSFADTPGGPDSLSLTVTGQAFTTLNLTYGFPGLESSSVAPIPYFPIRKAADSTQYVLGRAFLQETYLTVDYERNNFSLSQATFSTDSVEAPALVNIKSPDDYDSESSPPPLSTGAIIGIAVGVIIVLTLLICTVAICLLRRHFSRQVITCQPGDPPPPGRSGIAKLILGEQKVAELPAREFVPGDKPGSLRGSPRDYYAVDKKFPLSEVSDNEIRELPTPFASVAVELQGSPVPSHKRGDSRYGVAELPDRSSGDSAWRSPPESAAASSEGAGTFLTVSGFSGSDGRPSPTTPNIPSSPSTRSESAKSSTSLVSKFAQGSDGARRPSSGRPSLPSEQSKSRSTRESGAGTNRASRQSVGTDRTDAHYTIDDSIKLAFDPRQLRDAPKATRRKFSFEEEEDR